MTRHGVLIARPSLRTLAGMVMAGALSARRRSGRHDYDDRRPKRMWECSLRLNDLCQLRAVLLAGLEPPDFKPERELRRLFRRCHYLDNQVPKRAKRILDLLEVDQDFGRPHSIIGYPDCLIGQRWLVLGRVTQVLQSM